MLRNFLFSSALLLSLSNAMAMTCAEFNEQFARDAQAPGSHSTLELDNRIRFELNSALELFTVSVSEELFTRLQSQGASVRSAYTQSILVGYKSFLEVESKAKAQLERDYRNTGGPARLVAILCKGANQQDIGGFARVTWLRNQAADR